MAYKNYDFYKSHNLEVEKIIYSCDEVDALKFEEILEKNSIKFLRVDEIGEPYKKDVNCSSDKCQGNTNRIDTNEQVVFVEKVSQIIETQNKKQRLNEETVVRKDTIKVYIESNEMCNHNIPHAHVDYNNERNVFVISLIDYAVLVGDGGKRTRKTIELLKKHIVKARTIWNKCNNHIKFDVDEDGNCLDTYHYN